MQPLRYSIGINSVFMNHGMGPRPNRKVDMNMHRINKIDIFHGEPSRAPIKLIKVYVFSIYIYIFLDINMLTN